MMQEIPRVFHQIWLGPAALPEAHRDWAKTWQRHHPDWEYRLWGNEIRGRLPQPLHRCFDQAKNWAHKADIARYWLIAEHGGVYVDTDFECLRPFDDLIHNCQMFTCAAAADGRITNALFGAVPGHPAMQQVVEVLPDTCTCSVFHTGPRFFDRMVRHRSDVCVLPKKHFYEYDWSMARTGAEPRISKDAYGVHYFEASWAPKKQRSK